jgi:predicted transcriptional regulator with HTH domain
MMHRVAMKTMKPLLCRLGKELFILKATGSNPEKIRIPREGCGFRYNGLSNFIYLMILIIV